MPTRAGIGVAVLLNMPVLNGCIDDLNMDLDEDCVGRIRYEGILYAPHGDLNKAAPRAGELGTGEVVDCGDVNSAPKVAEVAAGPEGRHL
jgi:hypothetical protein